MKTLNLAASEVLATAETRGYSPEEIAPCVVKDLGNGRWLVDIESEHYPHDRGGPRPAPSPPPPPSHGPGTELKAMLAAWPFRITSSPTCQCNAMASKMDRWGPDECSKPERLDEVVAVMRQEAAKRGIVFSDAVAKLLVRSAIKRARKKAKGVSGGQSDSH